MAGGRGERAIRESPLRGGWIPARGVGRGLGRRGDVASPRSLAGPRYDNRQSGREWVHASAHLRPVCARDDGRRGQGLGRWGDVASPRSLAGPRYDNRQGGMERVHASAHLRPACARDDGRRGQGLGRWGDVASPRSLAEPRDDRGEGEGGSGFTPRRICDRLGGRDDGGGWMPQWIVSIGQGGGPSRSTLRRCSG